MTPSVSGTGSTGADTSSTTSTATQTVDKNMFLQLLVAQLQNQDPMNPSDGTQFLSQLAQFQQLEQSINSGQDITAIRQDLDTLVGAGSTGSTGTGSTGSGSNGTDSNSTVSQS
jgi:flagellar basal-body rod modification protein FlgD